MRPRWLVCGAAIFLLALLEVSVVAAGIGRFSSAAAARREASPTVVTSVKGPPLQDSTSEHSTVAATDVSPAPGAGNLPAAPTTEHDVQAGNHVPEPTTSGIAHSPDGDAILAGVPPLQTESSLLAAFAPSPAVAAVVQAGDDSLSDTAFQALIQAALRCQYDQGRSAAAAEAELADRVASTGDDAPAASLGEEGGEDDGDDEEERRVDARHPEEDQRACNRLRLRVALIRDYRARIAARDHAASAQVRESDLQGDMATVALASTGGAGFEGFFFDYEVPGKPVLIRTDASDQPPLHGVDAVDAAATWAEIRAGWDAMQALFPAPARPWSSCCRHHDRLLLPASAWNNYLPRLERLASEKPHRRQHPLDIRAAQDESSAFPRLLALGGGEVVPLHREPNAYHCFVTPLDHGIDVVVYVHAQSCVQPPVSPCLHVRYPRPEADKLDQDVLGRFTMHDPFHGSTTPQHARRCMVCLLAHVAACSAHTSLWLAACAYPVCRLQLPPVTTCSSLLAQRVLGRSARMPVPPPIPPMASWHNFALWTPPTSTRFAKPSWCDAWCTPVVCGRATMSDNAAVDCRSPAWQTCTVPRCIGCSGNQGWTRRWFGTQRYALCVVLPTPLRTTHRRTPFVRR